jgi:hypothetical protein
MAVSFATVSVAVSGTALGVVFVKVLFIVLSRSFVTVVSVAVFLRVISHLLVKG